VILKGFVYHKFRNTRITLPLIYSLISLLKIIDNNSNCLDQLSKQGIRTLSGKLIIMAGLALTFGTTSYVGGNYYLESKTQALTKARIDELESNRPVVKQVEFAKLVVAAEELKFGELITSDMLKVIDWPQESFPEGGFSSIGEITENQERRAMATIFPGEPIMTVKISGEDGKSGLAGLISEGMRAVTIPVNQVAGVGGFIQPGDRVDVIHTYHNNSQDESAANIILQNVKVLTVDQDAVERSEAARVANSVTLETDTKGARVIAKALNNGDLSLLLRGFGDNAKSAEQDSDGIGSIFDNDAPKTTSIKVVSGNEVTNFTVEVESSENEENINKVN